MIKLVKYTKLKSILKEISKELLLTLNVINDITVTNLGIAWEERVDNGKVLSYNNLKNEVVGFFGSMKF